MLATFVYTERRPCEDAADYNRRRMRIIGNLAREQGLWGTEHAQRIVAWAEHLERPHNHMSPAAQLYTWHGPAWLSQRRQESGTMRPMTRASSGFLPKWWGESVDEAKLHMSA